MRRQERPGPGQDAGGAGSPVAVASGFPPVEIRLLDLPEVQEILSLLKEEAQKYEDIVEEMKEGRVLSRKHREVVKNAVSALQAVLKADATGSREDEESESGTVTERIYELEKDGEKKTFTTEDIGLIIEKILSEKAAGIIEEAFVKNKDPEKIKKIVDDRVRLEIDRIKGKVR